LADVLPGLFGYIAAKSLALFCHHIGNVLFWRSDPKVSRINARWIITAMADSHPLGYSSVVQLIRYPMGRQILPAEWQLAITAGFERAFPYPALIGRAAIYFCPKADIKRFSRAVPCNVAKWLSLYPSFSGFRLRRDWRWLPAATHAKASRVGGIIQNWVLLFVAAYEFYRLAFYPAGFAISVCCNPSLSTAATVAVSVGDFLRRLFSGMIAHVVSPSKAIVHATGCSQHRGGFFIEAASIISQSGGIG